MEPKFRKTLTGKTIAMLDRLPHFSHADQSGGMLPAVVDLFGRRLERAEIDLYRVLRAHHVETADNEGAQGYTAAPELRGDLDKIFAMYLEALGGTALLVKVNPRFTLRSIDMRRLAKRLVEENSPLVRYFYRKFRIKTWKLLLRYDASRMVFKPYDIHPGFALALLLGHGGVARHIREKLAPTTRKLLGAYNGAPVLDTNLQNALARDLNERILRDASLYRKNEEELLALNPGPVTRQLINSLYLENLRAKYLAEPDPEHRARLLASLDNVEPAEQPAGDDLVRLNRLLLEAAFPYSPTRPWGFHPRGVPPIDQLREALAGAQDGELNLLLDDTGLYSEERFPEAAEDYPYLRKRFEKQLTWLNRTLLESAFPYEIEPSHAPYRDRLRGLISVLRRGASTRQGIIDIVAANLGIVGNDPQVRAVKELIDVEEFAPERTHFFDGKLALYEEFDVDNSNPAQETPEIWVRLLPGMAATLANVRFVHVATRKTIRVATPIQAGDTLVFTDSGILLNGVTPPDLAVGSIPPLKPGKTRWRFEADVVSQDDKAIHPVGRYDQANFDDGLWVMDAPVVSVEVMSYRTIPGTFTVVIPWHIPGFTDKFAETEQHPRHQILALVNKVKAAGVLAQVAYKQVYREDQGQQESLGLGVKGALLHENADALDTLTARNTQNAREDLEISDSFSLAGRFDTTYFDSLNTFSG